MIPHWSILYNAMKKNLIQLIKTIVRLLPEGAPEFIYVSLLRPKPLKALANAVLSAMIPETATVGDGSIIALNKKDAVVSGALMFGVYEKFETELIRKKLGPGMTVIDIGANIGYYTAIAAQAVGPAGRVIAFEPDPENFAYLEKTVVLNKLTNVTCYQVAIADSVGAGHLFLSPENNKGDQRIYASPEKRESIGIQLTTLDAFIQGHDVPRVDFIKMDIQGAEGLALAGMKKTIGDNGHLMMFTEFWPMGIERTGQSPLAFLNILKELGMNIFDINRKNGELIPVTDTESTTHKFKGREFANLYCEK